jgi:uncharacterized protein with HEPN domain
MSKRTDLLYFGHMIDAARGIQARVTGRTRAEFDASEDLQIILTHLLQVIGEAARQVPEETRLANPQIEWTKIIGMRHRIVHNYTDINLKVVWDTATADIPVLIAALEEIIPRDPSSV